MENQYHCMNIKQAKLILNAHKHNILTSFCNNGYFHVKQHENNRISLKNQERESFYDSNCLVGFVIPWIVIPWQNDQAGR